MLLGDCDLIIRPRARCMKFCPLPLRERASRCFDEEEWVRGLLRESLCEATPSPYCECRATVMPSPARGEGKIGRQRTGTWPMNLGLLAQYVVNGLMLGM